MYEKGRKYYPTYPKSLEKIIDQLKNLHEDYFFFNLIVPNQYVHVQYDKNIICLPTLSNINLFAGSTEFFGGGMFDYAKKDLDRINLTIQSYNDYKNHQNVIQYLKNISCHYKGGKI